MESSLGPYSLRLEAYSNYLIIGGTCSGKSTTTVEIVKNRNKVFTVPVDRVIYYTISPNQDIFEQINDDEDVVFVQNVSDFEAAMQLGHNHVLVVFDDLAVQAMGKLNAFLVEYFCIRSHHCRSSTLFQSQVMFARQLRVLMTNCQYFILKKTPFQSQLAHFFRQIDGKRWRALLNIYTEVLSEEPFNLLVVSVHARTNPRLFLRDFIIPREGGRIFLLK